MEEKLYFPVFVDISDKKILVVGGGTIATRRIRALLPFTSQLLVVAPQVTREIEQLSEAGQIHLYRRNYEKTDVEDVYLVVAATNVRKVNHRVGQDARKAGAFVSVADCKEECNMLFPGIALQEGQGLVAGITASGRNHRLAKIATEKIKNILKNMETTTDN